MHTGRSGGLAGWLSGRHEAGGHERTRDVEGLLRKYRAGKLVTSARNSDLESISELLAANADPNQVDDEGQLPLNAATYTGVTAVVRELLVARADANVPAQDAQGFRPLQVAAWQGHTEVTRLLLRSFASVNGGTWTPLCSAAKQGHAAIVSLLVSERADISQASGTNGHDHMTPLQAAAKGGHVEVAQVLKAALAKAPASPVITRDRAKTGSGHTNGSANLENGGSTEGFCSCLPCAHVVRLIRQTSLWSFAGDLPSSCPFFCK